MADAFSDMTGTPRQQRILVAEDDALMRDIVRHVLTKSGFLVILAGDGEEALEQVKSRRPDAIILDAMMPNMDGMEFLHDLRSDAVTRDIPVMMLSSRGLEKDVVSGFDFGANDYLIKPFKPDELIVRLKRLLNRQVNENH